jgi:hypothetical protein
MCDPAGGFYSAEDADSVIDPAEPTLKGEGAFYIWQADEIRDLVGPPLAEWFGYRYGVAEGGNVASDPHGEFTGRNILYQAATLEETAEQFGRAAEEIRAGLEKAGGILMEARSKRVRPHLDDKVLTSWNGLMISAFALGGAALQEPRYADAARRAAEFVLSAMAGPTSGVLLRRYRQGEAAIPGFLDDYALFTQALLDLYESQFDLRHLQAAIRLTEKQIELFEDREHGGFFSSTEGDGALVMRLKEDYDGAEPSGNSIAIRNLLRLAEITNRPEFREAAMKALRAFHSRLSTVPAAVPEMLAACEFLLGDPRQIILVGARDVADFTPLLRALHARFLPNRIVLRVDSPEARTFFALGIPSIASMQQPGAYVCRNYTCQLPVFEAGAFSELIQ